MRILITAGSTEVPIDTVRSITNIFKGKTGAQIANHFGCHDHEVTLLTSGQPIGMDDSGAEFLPLAKWLKFKTFDELAELMEQEIRGGNYDVVIHSAAVSDYNVAKVFTDDCDDPVGEGGGKIASTYDRLYLELTPTPKLVDKIRDQWSFKGKLVKFKLQVGISDEKLIEIALKSMTDSGADFIVANCFEWYREYAYIIDTDGNLARVARPNLPAELLWRLVG